MSDSVRPQRRKPTRLPRSWDSLGKNTGVGCHFLLQCMKVKSEREVAQSCPTFSDPMDYSLPGSSIHGIFQARLLEWGAIAFSNSLVWQWEIGHPLSWISLRCIVSTCIYLINLTVCNQSPNTATPWIWCCALRLWYLLLGHSFFHIWTAALVCYIFDTTCWTTVFTGRRAERFSSCLYL